MVWLDEAEDRAVVLRLDFRARTALHYFFNPTTFVSTTFSTLLTLSSLFFNPTTLVSTIFSTLLPLSSLFFQSYYLCLHYFFNPTTFGSRHSARQDNNDQEHRRQNLKQNESQSARAESTHKGVKWHSKDVTQRQQQRPVTSGHSRLACDVSVHTPSIAFRHRPPNSARFSYATEGALFISAQLSTDAVTTRWRKDVLNQCLEFGVSVACMWGWGCFCAETFNFWSLTLNLRCV